MPRPSITSPHRKIVMSSPTIGRDATDVPRRTPTPRRELRSGHRPTSDQRFADPQLANATSAFDLDPNLGSAGELHVSVTRRRTRSRSCASAASPPASSAAPPRARRCRAWTRSCRRRCRRECGTCARPRARGLSSRASSHGLIRECEMRRPSTVEPQPDGHDAGHALHHGGP